MYNIPANTLIIGKQIIYLPTCHSTNDIALNLANAPGALEGTVVITSSQTAGRGQRGNTWESEDGKNLTFSFILRPNFLNPLRQFDLNITVCLAVHDFLTNYLSKKVKIKWPNDIFYEDKKLCGILIENTIKGSGLQNSIVGIGINVNQDSFSHHKATSLKKVSSLEYNLESLLTEFCVQMDKRYLQLRSGQHGLLKNEYLEKLYWFGEEHLFQAEDLFKGTITGIDESGRLLVKGTMGERGFNFKELVYIE